MRLPSIRELSTLVDEAEVAPDAPLDDVNTLRFIELLKRRQQGVSNVREDTPEQHQQKTGTPTMGGLFILLAVAFPSFLDTERFIFYGVVPLILVPITFAYAIVRFQLLDIRVILRKSLLYAVTTALVHEIDFTGLEQPIDDSVPLVDTLTVTATTADGESVTVIDSL